jgi:threonine dehydratase
VQIRRKSGKLTTEEIVELKTFQRDFKEKVSQAYERIRFGIKKTPLEHSPALSQLTGAEVYLKWESEQLTGSFKLRGALNKLRALSPEEKRRGVVSASTGNHGLGLSLAARIERVTLVLVLPATVSPSKRSRLREYGAEIIEHGLSCERAEIYARQLAAESGRIYVSPYNDEDIIYGQGTTGLEIWGDLPGVQDVLIPVGGGGLASGIAGYLKTASPKIKAFGVEPRHSAFMAASIDAGKIVEVEEKETIADAVAGGIEPGAITFPLCQELLDGMILVEEELISEALVLLKKTHDKIVEGAGALSLAALMKESGRFSGRQVVLVVSGGNASHHQISTQNCR